MSDASPDARASKHRTGAADRVLTTLEVVISLAPDSTLGAIAEACGLPKPTVHRLLQTLVERGYVYQVDDGRYSPDLRILRLAAKVQDSLDLPQRAHAVMLQLQDILAETVHLAVLQGDFAVYVAKLEGHRAYRMASTVGMPLALNSTAIGKAVLAYLHDAELEQRLTDSKLARRTARTITSRGALEAELQRIRVDGYAIDDEENEDHLRCVGAAVFDHRCDVVGGVSLSAPAFALSLQQAHDLGPHLTSAARQISLNLGARLSDLPEVYRNQPQEPERAVPST